MDFGKFIHELLLENEMVIIPGFGAFVSEYKPAEISEESDQIKPPSKIITFNQQIRNNDGLLVGYVAEIKRVSHFDALKKIEKERDEILYKLDSGEKVELTDVGVLFHTEENTIGFHPIEDENMLLDSFGLEATSISAQEEETPEEKTIEEETIDAPVVEEKILETAQAPKPGEVEEPKEEIEENSIPTPIPAPGKFSDFKKEEATEEKKKRGWLWLLLILIPLIAVSIFVYLQGTQKNTAPPKTEPEKTVTQIEKPAVVSEDTTESDTIKLTAEDTVPAEPEEQKLVDESEEDTPKYYLVGGSFSIEENAETFMDELKAKGLSPFHVGKKGRFFIIGLSKYDTFGEAEQAKKVYMEENPGSEVWVWKK